MTAEGTDTTASDGKPAETKTKTKGTGPKNKLSVQDRVTRASGDGCQGTVVFVRDELLSPSSNLERELVPMVKVLWDNGTLSYYAPDALTKLQ